MSDAIKKRLLEAQNAAQHGSYVERMAAGAELGAATRAIFDELDRLQAVADENHAALRGRVRCVIDDAAILLDVAEAVRSATAKRIAEDRDEDCETCGGEGYVCSEGMAEDDSEPCDECFDASGKMHPIDIAKKIDLAAIVEAARNRRRTAEAAR